MGGCQNCGLFLGTLNIRCHIGIQKGTIILTSIHKILRVHHNNNFTMSSGDTWTRFRSKWRRMAIWAGPRNGCTSISAKLRLPNPLRMPHDWPIISSYRSAFHGAGVPKFIFQIRAGEPLKAARDPSPDP